MFAAEWAFEQVRNSIGYPHLNVKIGATHGGISVGEDGASHADSFTFEIGKGEVLRNGSDVAPIANGLLVAEALEAANLLAEQEIGARVINMAAIKPLDEELVLKAARECGKIVTCEEHSTIGGLGEAVCAVIAQHGLACPVERVGINDEFGRSAPAGALLKQFGLYGEHIAQVAQQM